jgi:hypothetical protein
MKAHTRKHSGEEPYECMHCARKFKWRSSLKSHESGCSFQPAEATYPALGYVPGRVANSYLPALSVPSMVGAAGAIAPSASTSPPRFVHP